MRLGHNTEDGKVYCGLCDWQHQCHSYEEIEHRLKEHLREAHGRKMLWAVENENKKLKEVPQ